MKNYNVNLSTAELVAISNALKKRIEQYEYMTTFKTLRSTSLTELQNDNKTAFKKIQNQLKQL